MPISRVKAIRDFFSDGEHGRKVTMSEMKELSKEDLAELGVECTKALGEELEDTSMVAQTPRGMCLSTTQAQEFVRCLLGLLGCSDNEQAGHKGRSCTLHPYRHGRDDRPAPYGAGGPPLFGRLKWEDMTFGVLEEKPVRTR